MGKGGTYTQVRYIGGGLGISSPVRRTASICPRSSRCTSAAFSRKQGLREVQSKKGSCLDQLGCLPHPPPREGGGRIAPGIKVDGILGLEKDRGGELQAHCWARAPPPSPSAFGSPCLKRPTLRFEDPRQRPEHAGRRQQTQERKG